MEKNSNCPFCDLSDISKRLVCEWDDAYVVSDASPVTFGHLLIVSKSHCLSFGEMTKPSLVVLKQKITEISKVLMMTQPRVILFEHGNKVANKSGKPSVDHAHFHLIPAGDLQLQLPPLKKEAAILDLPDYVSKCSYYFYMDMLEDKAYWGNAEEIESQFIRKIVTAKMRLVDWNWRAKSLNNNYAQQQSEKIKTLLQKGG